MYILVFTIINVIVVLLRIFQRVLFEGENRNRELEERHTYIGDDYPLTFPMGPLEPVAMTLQETVRFQLNSTDPVAMNEWLLLTSIPEGFGRTRLGPQHRLFVISLYHQIHCLSKVRLAIVDRQSVDPFTTYEHVHHCLNYLRQTFLCDATDMVERGDFMKRDFSRERVGDTLVCKDWGKVYDALDTNFHEWVQWSNEWN